LRGAIPEVSGPEDNSQAHKVGQQQQEWCHKTPFNQCVNFSAAMAAPELSLSSRPWTVNS